MGLRNLSKQLSCTISDGNIFVRLIPKNVENNDETFKWQAGEEIELKITNIKNQISFALTDPFQFYISEGIESRYYVNYLETGSQRNTAAGPMTGVKLLPDTNTLGVVTNYAIYFTIVNELPEGSFVDIYFPRGYYTGLDQVLCKAVKKAGPNTTCYVPDETTVDANTGQEVDMSNVIRIAQAFEDGNIESNTEIAFVLEGIRNPESSIDAETIAREFVIQTVSPTLYPIDGSYNLDFAIGCVFPCATCDSV